MRTSPEAVVDCLYICRAIGDIAGGAGEVEIVNLGYLSCLLAVYDGMPPSEWGYSFAATRSFAPYSYSLADAIQGLQQSGLIEDKPEGFRLTDQGDQELTRLAELRRFRDRLGYVAAACQSTTAIPLPMVTSSLAAEPQLVRAVELSSLRALLDDIGRRALITHFAALAEAVPHSSDLFVPAVVWLTYLARQIDQIAAVESQDIRGLFVMVSVNPAEMAAIAETLFVPRVQTDMGPRGVETLKRLLPFIRQVHHAIAAERLTKGMEIVCSLDGSGSALAAPYQRITDSAALTAYFQGDNALTVQLMDDGLFVWAMPLDVMPDFEFVGYRYSKPHSEVIFTREKTYEIPVISASPSYFGIPYFRQLTESLQEYGGTWIKNSVCEIFNAAWLDGKRTVFLPRPEVLMRRSLQRHLRSGLRELSGLTVMPEQNVNETRPVDIKLTWGAFNRVALIEIKWLGRSVDPSRMVVTQNFTAGRAREGADQLATYLDLYHRESPHEEARGYLVVYDARRRGVVVPIANLAPGDAVYYRYEEIDYDPSILNRSDFEHPVRLFCEPILIYGLDGGRYCLFASTPSGHVLIVMLTTLPSWAGTRQSRELRLGPAVS